MSNTWRFQRCTAVGAARLYSGRRPPLGGRTRLVIIIIKQENNEWRIVKEAVKLLHAFKDLKAKVKYHHQCQGLKSLRTDSGYRSVSSEREWVPHPSFSQEADQME